MIYLMKIRVFCLLALNYEWFKRKIMLCNSKYPLCIVILFSRQQSPLFLPALPVNWIVRALYGKAYMCNLEVERGKHCCVFVRQVLIDVIDQWHAKDVIYSRMIVWYRIYICKHRVTFAFCHCIVVDFPSKPT